MTTPAKSTDIETAVELAKLRTELHGTNSSMNRAVSVMEETYRDMNKRLVALEEKMTKMTAIIQLIAWLGAPAAAGAVFFLSRHA